MQCLLLQNEKAKHRTSFLKNTFFLWENKKVIFVVFANWKVMKFCWNLLKKSINTCITDKLWHVQNCQNLSKLLHTINPQYQISILISIELHQFIEKWNCWAKLKKLIFFVLLRKNWFLYGVTKIKILISLNILCENAWNFLKSFQHTFYKK